MSSGNIYGKTNIPTKVIRYTGVNTDTAETIVDNENNTIAVNVDVKEVTKDCATKEEVEVKANKIGPLPSYSVNSSDIVYDFINNNDLSAKPIVLIISNTPYFATFTIPSSYYISFEIERCDHGFPAHRYAGGLDISSTPSITFNDLINISYRQDYEITNNKVTSISDSSTDTEYPSAKCVYDNLELKADKVGPLPSISLTQSTDYIIDILKEQNLFSTPFIVGYQYYKFICYFASHGGNSFSFDIQQVGSNVHYYSSHIDATGLYFYDLIQKQYKVNFEIDINKVTSLSNSSTDTQYPSAKCVYDSLLTKSNATNIENGTGVNSVQQKQSDKDVEFENPNYTPSYTYEVGAFGKDSTMLNGNSMAKGELSIAIGRNTLAEGARSFASGTKTAATANNAHAEGLQTLASGVNGAHAEGSTTVASGSASHAEGNNTKALGAASHAEGTSTTATSDYSHAGGRSSDAHAEGAFAHGKGIYVNQPYQTSFGKYNKVDSHSIFSVGNGSDDSHRDNAFEVMDDGSAKVNNKTIATTDQCGTKLYRHHFAIAIEHADLTAIPEGSMAQINVNAISTDSEVWETLSELDGGGFIVSAFGTIISPAVVTSVIFELKIYYDALGTLLLNIHNITNGEVSCVALTTVDGGNTPSTYHIQDSATPL